MCVCLFVMLLVSPSWLLFWSTVKRVLAFLGSGYVSSAQWCDVYLNTALSRALPEHELLLKGAWACVASENKALDRHQHTGVMWNLRRPAAHYCIFRQLASPLAPYLPFFFSFLQQLLPKTPPVVFIPPVPLVALPLHLSLLQHSYCEKPL